MKEWEDLTIDTNVLMHCSNPNEDRFEDARAFVVAFLESPTGMCVDEGFSVDSAQNRSHIGSEYLTWLVPGTLGYQAVAHVAASNRLRFTSKKIAHSDLQRLNKLIKDKSDRPFVRVAMNSSSKVLVSHDVKCFRASVCAKVSRDLQVTVLAAADV